MTPTEIADYLHKHIKYPYHINIYSDNDGFDFIYTANGEQHKLTWLSTHDITMNTVPILVAIIKSNIQYHLKEKK